jgi:hypothetical protein
MLFGAPERAGRKTKLEIEYFGTITTLRLCAASCSTQPTNDRAACIFLACSFACAAIGLENSSVCYSSHGRDYGPRETCQPVLRREALQLIPLQPSSSNPPAEYGLKVIPEPQMYAKPKSIIFSAIIMPALALVASTASAQKALPTSKAPEKVQSALEQAARGRSFSLDRSNTPFFAGLVSGLLAKCQAQLPLAKKAELAAWSASGYMTMPFGNRSKQSRPYKIDKLYDELNGWGGRRKVVC